MSHRNANDKKNLDRGFRFNAFARFTFPGTDSIRENQAAFTVGFYARQALARGLWQPLATCDTWSSCCSIAIAHVLTYASTRARTAASLDAYAFSMRQATVDFCVDSVDRSRARHTTESRFKTRVQTTACIESLTADQHNTRTTYAFCQATPTSTRPIYIIYARCVSRCARFRRFFLQLSLPA